MIQRLIKSPEGWAVVLDDALVQQMHLGPDAAIEVVARGDSVVIRRAENPLVSDIPDQLAKVIAASDAIETEYEAAFRKLAE